MQHIGKVLVIPNVDEYVHELGELLKMVENSEDYPPSLAAEILALQGELVAEKHIMDREALEQKVQNLLMKGE